MDLEKLKRKITNNNDKKMDVIKAKAYYDNKTDIVYKGVRPAEDAVDPLRTADNRISHNFHEILVDEKVSYMFTYPVLFDIDNNKKINEQLQAALGDEFERKVKNLAIEASNCGCGWLHYWIHEGEQKGFKYELVPTEEIIPIYSNGLERELLGIIRYYICNEEVEGIVDEQPFAYIEYWTDSKMDRYKFSGGSFTGQLENVENITHTLGDVPFIEFANNIKKQSDLSRYKDLVDLYDRVISGFANDLEDIQQIIYILENYGGEDLKEFLGDLKRYKAIKTESGEGGGGVKTLQIEIPVEARKVILEILKKQIYESGQGLQQDVESVGNASGVALKFFYRKLELKSGLMETEFRASFNKLIRVILKFLGITEYKKIKQIYTRNMISNDLENSQIAQMSLGIIPKKLILRNHPWVDDVEEALELLETESDYSDYSNFAEEINNEEE